MTDASSAYSWCQIPHLAQRTLWSLRKPAPDPEGERWLLSLLTPAESVLYRQMAAVDRAHAINCARVVESLGAEVVVASALHDVGKTQSGLGTAGRVAASLAGVVNYEQARSWGSKPGLRGQVALYLDHSDIGSAELQMAGASKLAVAWAREHHLQAEQQTIEPDLAAALKAADD
ncbi:MAG: hypothetical protein QMA93_02245 [Acidimicrobiales bacterium]